MRKSRYSDNQIMTILKQAEAGVPVADLCREHGMSNALFYEWQSRTGSMLSIQNRPRRRGRTPQLLCSVSA
ncbi:MAG: transposase [Pseudomonadota bacterium]